LSKLKPNLRVLLDGVEEVFQVVEAALEEDLVEAEAELFNLLSDIPGKEDKFILIRKTKRRN